ncbi:MAG: acyltransferase [Streptomyces sp.]|nr:acyltransferase [Streptomyces sp.]
MSTAQHVGRATDRAAHLDRVKVLLVAAIIAVHGVVGYSAWEGAWAYQPVREVALATVTEMAIGTLLLPALLFVMGVFFLVSGLVVPGSLDRRGPRGFARGRLLRLGVPYAVWVLLVWPAVVWAPRRVAGWDATYWEMFVGAEPFLDAGAMWFVGVLLLYSLVYAAWRGVQDRRGGVAGRADPGGAPVGARSLAILAGTVSVATALVRTVLPFDSHQVAELQVWQWPQYGALFGLGVVAARRGGLGPVPGTTRRAAGRMAAVALAAYAALFATVVARGLDPTEVFARPVPAPEALALALLEGPLAVGASVWVLALAQRRLDRPLDGRAVAVARSAYAAYLVQGVVLLGAALALRPVPVVAEVKALVVATVGVVGSFALGSLLVRRTPVGRVL